MSVALIKNKVNLSKAAIDNENGLGEMGWSKVMLPQNKSTAESVQEAAEEYASDFDDDDENDAVEWQERI